MRTLTGFLLGVLMTVGVAYWLDARAAPGEPRMVDWQVVSRHVESAKVRIGEEWDRLTAGLERNKPGPVKTESAT
jgi:hypothetical protein